MDFKTRDFLRTFVQVTVSILTVLLTQRGEKPTIIFVAFHVVGVFLFDSFQNTLSSGDKNLLRRLCVFGESVTPKGTRSPIEALRPRDNAHDNNRNWPSKQQSMATGRRSASSVHKLTVDRITKGEFIGENIVHSRLLNSKVLFKKNMATLLETKINQRSHGCALSPV